MDRGTVCVRSVDSVERLAPWSDSMVLDARAPPRPQLHLQRVRSVSSSALPCCHESSYVLHAFAVCSCAWRGSCLHSPGGMAMVPLQSSWMKPTSASRDFCGHAASTAHSHHLPLDWRPGRKSVSTRYEFVTRDLSKVVKQDGEVCMTCKAWNGRLLSEFLAHELNQHHNDAEPRWIAARVCMLLGFSESVNNCHGSMTRLARISLGLRNSLARFHGLMEKSPRFLILGLVCPCVGGPGPKHRRNRCILLAKPSSMLT